MKKQIFLATVLAFGVFFTTEAQEYLSIEMNDNTVHEFRVTDIKEVKIRVSEEDPNCPIAEAIDLGLPSGTKWASWNVGATNPEEYGGFFAWGETEEKSYYDWSTYSHSDGSNETCNHIGDDIAGTSYDVAHVKWGGNWTMPTRDQIEELINNCTHTWTTRNRVKGILITGPNGASIFLPAAGRFWEDQHIYNGREGSYWSSSLHPKWETYASTFDFRSDGWLLNGYVRDEGHSVRPVCK